MGRLILSRLLGAVPVLLLVSLIAVLIIQLMPGDPALTILGDRATPESIAEVRAELGLDKSLPHRYASWLGDATTGNLGESLFTGRSVTDSITSRLPVTLSLTLAALMVSSVVGVMVGFVAALRPGSWVDRLVGTLTALGLAVPNFWLAMVLVVIFALNLGWLPATGYTPLTDNPLGWLQSLALPVAALSLEPAAVVARQTRSALVGVLQQGYVRAAQARGVSTSSLLLRHTLKNGLIPVTTMIGLNAAYLIGGSIFVEAVFGMPGLGQLLITAVQERDVPMVQGILVFTAVLVVAVNFVVDITYAWINPKARAV